ncbi:CopM family metallochaperone [Aureimonas populi]|uniref:DUF305 domain-containing protein n=1 Tax=Aureimonas populi TaxID=1701758 RepID=A0ABW5CKX9_9HYPH|nr:DUF305 domain-containing protein [Aureimonas populi]
MRIAILAAAALMLAAPAAALAQGAGHAEHHDAPAAASEAPASPGASPSTAEFEAAAARMHEDMGVELTGDADVDFVRSMIPHHQGAIDMARIVLEHGQDPQIRALAEEVVSAQEAEIGEMRQWLADNGHAE